MVRILRRGSVKNPSAVGSAKEARGYGHVRSLSSRGREPLDRGSITRQSLDLTGVAQGLNPREQSKNPKRRRGKGPSGFGKSGFTRAEGRELPQRKSREDRDRSFVETRGEHRSVGSQEIRVPEVMRIGTSEVSKPR
jgi:hypothetical protein